jgi:uncharacterized repeat protein (TIGR03803 family)
MNIKHLRSIVVSVCLGWLAPVVGLAQPVITTQPANRFLSASSGVSITVGVTGVAPIAYQWLFDGLAITGATNYSLLVTNAQTAQGYYSVIVSNASGSVTSQMAELKVFVAAPHGFSSIQAESGGSVNLNFKGETTALFAPYYDLYPLETSSNLVDWAPLVTLQRTNTALDTLQFLDADAPQFSQRFYRTPTNALVTPDPQPTGPYPVGTFSMVMTDPSRTNAAGKTNYQFMVTFWYPAVAQAGVLPAKYVEPQVAVGETTYNGGLGGGNFSSQVAAFFSHSLSNAPLVTNPAKYPVVLYSPGWHSHRRDNPDKAEDLASWGYVVVGLDSFTTPVSVFPNGTVVYGQTVDTGVKGAVAAGIQRRLLDEQFVLDELERLNASDPQLGGRLDLDKIGSFGYSAGGMTALELCFHDPRCKAGVGLDSGSDDTNLLTQPLTQPLSVPWLSFRSGLGPDPDPGEGTPDGHPDNRWGIYCEQVTNAYWVKLVSTCHGNFGDMGLIVDSASLEAAWGLPMSGQFLPPARVSQIVRAYLLSFFNKFLGGEDDHLLDGPSPAYPEVMQFLSTACSSAPPEYPSAALVEGSDGNFYGTTACGGASGKGTVFQVTPAGVLTTLVSFNGTNGSYPAAGLVQGSDGNFYGTTEYGGTNGNNGTVFQMTPTGALTMLVSFNGTNGSYPAAGLVRGANGSFYGTTTYGGARGMGTVFEMTSAGVLTTLVSFDNSDGAAPLAALVQASDGNLYGTTSQGGNLTLNTGGYGNSGGGTVFKMTPAGTLTTLFVFDGSRGENPTARLVQGTNGNFYGAAAYGGNLGLDAGYGFGTVYKMTPAGTLTTLVLFNLANGYSPSAGLVQGNDGNFYGTTDGGGAGGGGTVFKMTPSGALTTLVSFNGAKGNSPQAPLVQGSDGNFYGTTTYGGAKGRGTVFQVTPAGVLTTLVSF